MGNLLSPMARKTTPIQIRISPELNEQFGETCEQNETTKSEVLTNFIKAYVAGQAEVYTDRERTDDRLTRIEEAVTGLADLLKGSRPAAAPELPEPARQLAEQTEDIPAGTLREKYRPGGNRADYAVRQGGRWKRISKSAFFSLSGKDPAGTTPRISHFKAVLSGVRRLYWYVIVFVDSVQIRALFWPCPVPAPSVQCADLTLSLQAVRLILLAVLTL